MTKTIDKKTNKKIENEKDPNLTSTIISSTVAGTKVGLTATKVAVLLNQNLSSLELWLDDVPYLGDLISLIFEVLSAIC